MAFCAKHTFLESAGKCRTCHAAFCAECLVFPARYEGFGLPVIEAMASGTPVVATRSTAIPEIAGDAAVLVEPGDPDAMAAGAKEALARREELVAAGLARAAGFRWEATAARVIEVYRDLIG